MSETAWLEGAISIEAALQAGSREVQTVYVRRDKWDRKTRRLLKLADAAGVDVERVEADFIGARAAGSTHGGIIAEVGRRKFTSLAELIAGKALPLIVMLDGIEDPFNFGQAVRALYAAGVHGLVVRPRNWLSATGVVGRASAGSSERMPTAVANSALEAAEFYDQHGLTIACADNRSAISIYDADLNIPLFLLIGGEKRGITRSFLDRAELRLQIPYGRGFDHALGVAASAAVFAFEILRRRE